MIIWSMQTTGHVSTLTCATTHPFAHIYASLNRCAPQPRLQRRYPCCPNTCRTIADLVFTATRTPQSRATSTSQTATIQTRWTQMLTPSLPPFFHQSTPVRHLSLFVRWHSGILDHHPQRPVHKTDTSTMRIYPYMRTLSQNSDGRFTDSIPDTSSLP